MIVRLALPLFQDQPILWPTVDVMARCWGPALNSKDFILKRRRRHMGLVGNRNRLHERAAEPFGPVNPFAPIVPLSFMLTADDQFMKGL
jgi:hypothetical protein